MNSSQSFQQQFQNAYTELGIKTIEWEDVTFRRTLTINNNWPVSPHYSSPKVEIQKTQVFDFTICKVFVRLNPQANHNSFDSLVSNFWFFLKLLRHINVSPPDYLSVPLGIRLRRALFLSLWSRSSDTPYTHSLSSFSLYFSFTNPDSFFRFCVCVTRVICVANYPLLYTYIHKTTLMFITKALHIYTRYLRFYLQ